MTEERADRVSMGRAVHARNFDVREDQAEALMVARAGSVFTEEAFHAAGGVGWQTPARTDRDRAVAVIAALVGQGVADDRLTVYLDLARRNGVDDEGLGALMVLLAAYLGQPSTSSAMGAVQRSSPARPRPDRGSRPS